MPSSPTKLKTREEADAARVGTAAKPMSWHVIALADTTVTIRKHFAVSKHLIRQADVGRHRFASISPLQCIGKRKLPDLPHGDEGEDGPNPEDIVPALSAPTVAAAAAAARKTQRTPT